MPACVGQPSADDASQRDYLLGAWGAVQRTEEGPVGEVEDAAVTGHHEVSVPEADHPGDRGVEIGAAHGAAEGGVAEGKDPAVAGDEPVAAVVGGRDQ